MLGTRMELTPPSFTLIFKQRLDRVCADVLFTFLACNKNNVKFLYFIPMFEFGLGFGLEKQALHIKA